MLLGGVEIDQRLGLCQFFVVETADMPGVGSVRHIRHALALGGVRDDADRLAGVVQIDRRQVRQGAIDFQHIGAVDLVDLPAKGAPAIGHRVPFDVLAGDERCRTLVVVDDRHDAVEIVRGGVHDGFPVRAFLHFTIAQHAVDARGNSLVAVGVGKADAPAQAMAKRPRRHLDAAHVVAVGVRAEAVADAVVVVQQLVPGVQAQVAENAVEQYAVMPLAEHEHIALRIFQIVRIEAKVLVVQRYRNVGGRQWSAKMDVAGMAGTAAQMLADFTSLVDQFGNVFQVDFCHDLDSFALPVGNDERLDGMMARLPRATPSCIMRMH